MAESIPKKFGRRLQELRKIKNLTQSQLAELAGVETMTISRIETGIQYPRPETLEKFSQVLDIEIKDFYDFGSPRTKEELLEKLMNILKNSPMEDLKFYNSIILCHLEYKNSGKIRQKKIV